MNELKEPLSNIVLVCDAHTPKPNPGFRMRPLAAFAGKHCKLAFHDQGRIEHMWVRCTGQPTETRHALCGTLASHPIVVSGLEYGDRIEFNRSEIEDVFEMEEPQA